MSGTIQGIGIGKNLALGKAYRHVRPVLATQKKSVTDTDAEAARLSAAVNKAQNDLLLLIETVKSSNEQSAELLTAQLEFLEDPGYLGAIEQKVQSERINAESAIEDLCNSLVQEFMALDDEYFRGRASDIQDMSTRLIANLSGVSLTSLSEIKQQFIVVAEDLLPSDTTQLNPKYVLGFCTEKGTATSHTALLANSLGIPAVVGCGKITVEAGDTLIVDGLAGVVWVNPSQDTIVDAERRIREYNQREQDLIARAQHPAITQDGVICSVYANIASATEAERALVYGAEGSGLLRTEFFFYQESTLPSEDRQFEIYAQVACALGARPITIRTLDIGGDKPLKSLQGEYTDEQNPFLGVRGVRLTDTQPELFASQLRALIRVATECDAEVKVMFPFVSTIEEVQRLHETMDRCHQNLNQEYKINHTRPQSGVMIEIPSAALMIDDIFEYSDFVSIGTNDLAQYTCAVDRNNERVSGLADYCHPAVLKLIQMVLDSGKRHNKGVSICGEMAGDALLIPLLYGMGLSAYSMSAVRIPQAKQILTQLQGAACATLAQNCLRAKTAAEVRGYLQAFADSADIIIPSSEDSH